MGKISIPIETYECLRGHLEKANEIFNSLGGNLKREQIKKISLKTKPLKETKSERENRYLNLIDSELRAKKPNHLRK